MRLLAAILILASTNLWAGGNRHEAPEPTVIEHFTTIENTTIETSGTPLGIANAQIHPTRRI